jgi:beta-galactosidase
VRPLSLILLISIALTMLWITTTTVMAETGSRENLNFNTNWLYSPNDYSNGYIKDLNDSSFTQVSVPHANRVLDIHKGPNFQSQIDSYRFVSWYRRHFSLPSTYSGKCITVEFQAVATVADIYVNGSYVGNHKGAYTTFSFDITKFVKTDGTDNVIAVRVDSTKHGDIPPEGKDVDYCLFGGIVRDVNMIITDPLHVNWTFMSTPGLTSTSGKVNAQTNVINSSTVTKNCTVETTVQDASGNTLATASSSQSIAAGISYTFNHNTTEISNPHLWRLDDPYLYTVITKVKDGSTYVDVYKTTIGFRWFNFNKTSSDGSFYLNGTKVKLMGINRHEQWPWQGRAVPNKLQAADADLIKATGLNAVRCSHYPQDPEFLKRCDEIGLLVFEEAPGWQFIGDENWQAIYKKTVQEMITRDWNHPSIISWGVRVNESDDNHNLYTAANALAKQLDPTRPTHGVTRGDSYGSTELLTDIFTCNYQFPATPRFTPFVITEHSQDWGGDGSPWSTDTAAVNFLKSFASSMDYYYGNNLCAGGFGWSMFDYNNEVNYTRTNNVFYSGIYDLFRLDKPATYLYKSQKDPAKDPMVYIANYWTSASPKTVDVLSNCSEVELFVNGVSQGKKKPNIYTKLPHPVFEFTNIAYSAGELKAVGYIGGVQKASYSSKTPGAATKLILTPDYTTLTADGSDMTSVTITAVDANGTRVPYANNTVTISLSGPGKFIGEKSVQLEGGRMAFFVQSNYYQTGTVTCNVSSSGLTPASCSIEVNPFSAAIAPVSFGNGIINPIKSISVNDNTTGTSENQFNYVGSGWNYNTDSRCYSNDNHWTSTANSYCQVKFNGTNIKWYGTKAPDFGILAASIDGGSETLVDCYTASRQDQVVLYNSGTLSPGQHTLKIRVTGTKNASSTNYYINPDRVDITNETVAPTFIYGDVNGDNIVNSLDFAALKSYLLGKTTEFPVESGLKAADVNGDNKVDVMDFSVLKMYLLGKISDFPVNK